MADSKASKSEFRKKLNALIDGDIGSNEFEKLERQIRNNPDYLDEYIEFIHLIAEFQNYSTEARENIHSSQDSIFWQLLAEDEKTAEALQIQQEKPSRPVQQTKIVQQSSASKLSLYTAIISTAAFLLLLAYIHFIPSQRNPIVARMGKVAMARWANPDLPVDPGQDLRTGSRKLIEGYAEILFDSGAKVILEAPVEFDLEDAKQLYINFGKMTAKVPAQAVGFTVRTPKSTVVDYGTEFGVKVESDGNTQAHVFTGEVEIRLGSDIRVYDQSLRMTAGQGASVGSHTIIPVDYTPETFVVKMPSLYNQQIDDLEPLFIWRKYATPYKPFFKEPVSKQIENFEEVPFDQRCEISSLKNLKSALFHGPNRLKVKIPNEQGETLKSDAFTFVFWFKADTLAEQDIISNYSDVDRTVDKKYRNLYLRQDGKVVYYWEDPVNSTQRNVDIITQTRIIPGQWYQAVLTGDRNGSERLDLNGRPEGSCMRHGTYREFDNVFMLGGKAPWDLQYKNSGLKGEICELIVFDKELTAPEILELYEASLKK